MTSFYTGTWQNSSAAADINGSAPTRIRLILSSATKRAEVGTPDLQQDVIPFLGRYQITRSVTAFRDPLILNIQQQKPPRRERASERASWRAS